MKYIYKIPEQRFRQNLEMMSDLLRLHEFIQNPVRQLSLGQRMRVEIAVALLHNPSVLFLDEPTIGLDVVAKLQIRKFIKQINQNHRMTVVLTTHDMDDIEFLCHRVIVIDNGVIFYDGGIPEFANQFGYRKELVIEMSEEHDLLKLELDNCSYQLEDQQLKVQFNPNEISVMQLIPQINAQVEIIDLTVRDIGIEKVLQELFSDREI
jgi:ABC-2 type transport system ATP-binding protein